MLMLPTGFRVYRYWKQWDVGLYLASNVTKHFCSPKWSWKDIQESKNIQQSLHSDYIEFTLWFHPIRQQEIFWMNKYFVAKPHFTVYDCEYMKIVYLNCGLKNECVIHHHSYEHLSSSSENKGRKKFRLVRESNPWPQDYSCSALHQEHRYHGVLHKQ